MVDDTRGSDEKIQDEPSRHEDSASWSLLVSAGEEKRARNVSSSKGGMSEWLKENVDGYRYHHAAMVQPPDSTGRISEGSTMRTSAPPAKNRRG
jgi:hypothetical protein